MMSGSDFNANQPIYLQLMNRICSEIVSGKRKVGEKLPSVRGYAIEVGVNVNTVQRVYRELEHIGITETRRGQGTFITKDETRLAAMREKMKQEIVEAFIHNMCEMGYSKEEIISSIKKGVENHD